MGIIDWMGDVGGISKSIVFIMFFMFGEANSYGAKLKMMIHFYSNRALFAEDSCYLDRGDKHFHLLDKDINAGETVKECDDGHIHGVDQNEGGDLEHSEFQNYEGGHSGGAHGGSGHGGADHGSGGHGGHSGHGHGVGGHGNRHHHHAKDDKAHYPRDPMKVKTEL